MNLTSFLLKVLSLFYSFIQSMSITNIYCVLSTTVSIGDVTVKEQKFLSPRSLHGKNIVNCHRKLGFTLPSYNNSWSNDVCSIFQDLETMPNGRLAMKLMNVCLYLISQAIKKFLTLFWQTLKSQCFLDWWIT